MHTVIETRFLDAEGETVDVSTHDTVTEARADLPAIECGAWVMERRTCYNRPGRPDLYRVIACGGDARALKAAGF